MSATEPQKKQQVIPGYQIIRKLGAGGMGAVYLARQQSMDRLVALKVLPRKHAGNKKFKERFFREARAAGRLNHPNIVAGIDASEAAGYCYLVMEYVDGESVADKLKREKHISEEETLDIAMQIAAALGHAWENGIIHRDVKPANLLLAKDGTAKLCDLGVAKASADANLTQDGTALGTPNYISPEQVQGATDVDLRADIYSLGASMYAMLAGAPPFEGPTAPAVMLKHVREPLPPLRRRAPGVSAATAAVVEKMLAKKPEKRYQSAQSLLADLRAAREGRPVSARPKRTSARTRVTRSATRARPPVKADPRVTLAVKVGAACLGLVICGVAIGSFLGSGSEPSTPTRSGSRSSGSRSPSPRPPAVRTTPKPKPTTGSRPRPPRSAPIPRSAPPRPTPAQLLRQAERDLGSRDMRAVARALEQARRLGARARPLAGRIAQVAAGNERSQLRRRAVTALAAVDPEAALREARLQLTGDRNENVRLAAVRLLAARGDRRALPALRRVQREDPSPVVAQAAAQALARLGGRHFK